MPVRTALLIAVALAAASCAPATRAPEPWRPEEFFIGVRAEPPRQPQTYAQIVKAGFNAVVGDVGQESLDLARQHGLRLAMGRVNLHPAMLKDDGERERAEASLRRLRSHKGLWGYFLTERIRQSQFVGWGSVTRFVRQHNPAAGLYVELLPCDAFVGPELETADYASYLERFVRVVDPPLLAVAQHPFRTRGPSAAYYENLELLRAVSLRNGLPFFHGLQAGPGQGLRAPTAGELRWQVYTSLAYGAKGIVWSGWWGASDAQAVQRSRWLIELNREAAQIGRQLLPLRSVAVTHTGDVPAGATRLSPHGLVGAVSNGSVVLGVFQDWKAEEFLLFVNKDTAQPLATPVALNHPGRAVWAFEPGPGLWRRVVTRNSRAKTEFDLELPPGGGVLLRLGPPGN